MVERNRNSNLTIGTTPVRVSELVDTKQKRILITLSNISTGGQTINLSIGNDAVSGVGLSLAVGGFYQEVRSEGFEATQDFISAISSVAGGTLSIQERML